MIATLACAAVGCAAQEHVLKLEPLPDSVLAPYPEVVVQFDDEVHVVTVTTQETMAERVASGVMWNHSDFTPDILPLTKTSGVSAPVRIVAIEFMHFTGPVDTIRARRLMERHHCRPATAEEVFELLKEAPEYPAIVNQPVVALGTEVKMAGGEMHALVAYRAQWIEHEYAYRKWANRIGSVIIEQVGPKAEEFIRYPRVAKLRSIERGWPAGWRFAVVREEKRE